MRIETLLNKVYWFKSFIYESVSIETIGGREALVVIIDSRKNAQGRCSGCGEPGSTYDHMKGTRDFSFVPLYRIPVYFRYRMRRIDCPDCGVRVEQVPWAEGNSPVTKPFALFLARWAKKMSWKEVAESFGTTWDIVWRSVKQVVAYGLAHRDMEGITAIGVDEIQYKKGQNYLTLVYQINQGTRRLLYVGKKRKTKTLLRFFWELGKARCQKVAFVCSDMWKPYIKVISKKVPDALHILDRFHIVQKLGKAIDKVRAAEIKKLASDGYDESVLKNTKYCFLKNEENLTEKQELKLNDVLQYDLKTVRAYLLKQSFRLFWNYKSPYWANWYFEKWCARAMRSRLEPIKQFVRMLRRHQPLIMNWFKAKKQYSSGIVEGLNRKINLVTRKSYGFRNYEILKTALFLTVGHLPEPEFTHRFS